MTPEQERDLERRTPTAGASSREADPRRDPDALQEDIERRRASMDDTLDALEARLSPEQLMSQAMAYLRGGPGEYFGNLARTARDNPMPLALTGIGLTWLMASQAMDGGHARPHRRHEPRSADLDEVTYGDYYARYLAEEHPFEEDEIDFILYEDLGPEELYYGDEYAYVTGAEGETSGESTREGVAGRAAAAGERARHGVERLSEETRARLDRTRERMSSAGAEAQARLREARHTARRRARRAYAMAREQARHARHQVADFAQEYPLVVTALGLAAGAALGGALPSSHAENRMMGRSSDRVKHQAAEMAREQAERATRTVVAAGEAASREAEAQGLTREGAKAEMREMGERAGQVAEAARDEAERQGLSREGMTEELERGRDKARHVAEAAAEAAREEANKPTPKG